MMGFELAQYVSTGQSLLLFPCFSCSQGWDRGDRGDFWGGMINEQQFRLGGSSGLEGSTSPKAQPSSSWNTIIAFIEMWQLVKILSLHITCSLNIFSLLFVNKQKKFSWFKMWRKMWGEEHGEEEKIRKCVEGRERRWKATNIQVINRAQDVLFYLQ